MTPDHEDYPLSDELRKVDVSQNAGLGFWHRVSLASGQPASRTATSPYHQSHGAG